MIMKRQVVLVLVLVLVLMLAECARVGAGAHYLEHLSLGTGIDQQRGQVRSGDSDGGSGGWAASDAQHIFVLFTDTRDAAASSPSVDVFLNVSRAVQQRFRTTSASYFVESIHGRHIGLWGHECPAGQSGEVQGDCLVAFEKMRPDRSCLMAPPVAAPSRSSATFTGNIHDTAEVEKFIKIESGVFIEEISQGIAVQDLLYKLPLGYPQDTCSAVDLSSINLDVFLREYWLPQKPVIIKNAKNFTDLPLLDILSKYKDVNVGAKLSPDVEFEGVDSLLNWEMAGEQDVPKKVLQQMQSPDRVVVRAAHEDMSLGQVLKLLTKNKVKRRSKGVWKQHQQIGNVGNAWKNYTSTGSMTNVYVEYMPLDSTMLLPLYYDLLEVPQRYSTDDIHNNKNINCSNNSTKYPGFPSWMDTLQEGTPYLWLGDGFAVGKMHFDPFDNILLQVEGSKTFKLIDTADNQRLYEGHMREAQLEARRVVAPSHPASFQYKFKKRRLLESTSMVHTPIFNSHRPNDDEFPRSENIPFIECKVDPGDMLFVPSFWWHEVVSTPGTTRNEDNMDPMEADNYVHLNVAINHWFDPLFLKEYPCATCAKYPNKKYGDILEGFRVSSR